MQVRITKCSNSVWWYANKIDEVIPVKKEWDDLLERYHFRTKHYIQIRDELAVGCIEVDDCEIINEA